MAFLAGLGVFWSSMLLSLSLAGSPLDEYSLSVGKKSLGFMLAESSLVVGWVLLSSVSTSILEEGSGPIDLDLVKRL